MKEISPLQQTNRVSSCTVRNNQDRSIIQQAVPENPSRDLGYVDGRCLHLLNPDALLSVLPKQISNPKVLEQYIEKNPELGHIIQEYGLDIKNGDYRNFLKYSDEHMRQTAHMAGKICDEVKAPVNKSRVVKAARLHDIGKIFIPREILNKPDNLTGEEKATMDVHSDLGYQLLKTLKFDPQTLALIKNHHNFDSNSPLEQQIVSAADVYSALTEKRPYKKSMDSQQAIDIMSSQGTFSNDIMDAIKKVS